MFMCTGPKPVSVSGVPPSLGVNQAWHHSLWKANVFGPFPFHFTHFFFFFTLLPEWRRQGNQCQSKHGVPIMNRPNQNDTDKGRRSDVGKCGKGQSWLWRGKGTGTDLSGFDGSLKHCSERGAVISLTIPPFSLLRCNEYSLRGRLVTKHRARLGEVCKVLARKGSSRVIMGIDR